MKIAKDNGGNNEIWVDEQTENLITAIESQTNPSLRLKSVFKPLNGSILYNVIDIEDKAVNPRPMVLEEAQNYLSSLERK